MPSAYDRMRKSRNVSVSGFANRVAANSSASSQLINIPLDHIDAMPDNQYLFPSDENVINSLVREIRNSGFNDPLIVVPEKEKPGYYRCLSGHQRKAALERLGWTSAPCYVRSSLSEEEARDFFISANVVVRKLSPLSIARIADDSIRTYEKRKQEPGFDFRGDKRDYAAQRCQVSRTYVQKYLAILKFPKDIQDRCADADFPFGALYDARKFDDRQMELLSEALKQYDADNPNIMIKRAELDAMIRKISLRTAENGYAEVAEEETEDGTRESGDAGDAAFDAAGSEKEEESEYPEKGNGAGGEKRTGEEGSEEDSDEEETPDEDAAGESGAKGERTGKERSGGVSAAERAARNASYQNYRKKMEERIGMRGPGSELADDSIGNLAEKIYRLYGGKVSVGNREAVRNSARLIADCMEKILKLAE